MASHYQVAQVSLRQMQTTMKDGARTRVIKDSMTVATQEHFFQNLNQDNSPSQSQCNDELLKRFVPRVTAKIVLEYIETKNSSKSEL